MKKGLIFSIVSLVFSFLAFAQPTEIEETDARWRSSDYYYQIEPYNSYPEEGKTLQFHTNVDASNWVLKISEQHDYSHYDQSQIFPLCHYFDYRYGEDLHISKRGSEDLFEITFFGGNPQEVKFQVFDQQGKLLFVLTVNYIDFYNPHPQNYKKVLNTNAWRTENFEDTLELYQFNFKVEEDYYYHEQQHFCDEERYLNNDIIIFETIEDVSGWKVLDSYDNSIIAVVEVHPDLPNIAEINSHTLPNHYSDKYLIVDENDKPQFKLQTLAYQPQITSLEITANRLENDTILLCDLYSPEYIQIIGTENFRNNEYYEDGYYYLDNYPADFYQLNDAIYNQFPDEIKGGDSLSVFSIYETYNYHYGYQIDTIRSNKIYFKEGKNKVENLIAIESGEETICYKDTTFIHLKGDKKVDYTWMRDYRTSGLTKYNDNKGVKAHKLGDYRYVEYRNYPNDQCPNISNLVSITKGTDCEGLVQGNVKQSISPYGTIGGIKVKSDLNTYAITDQEGNFEFSFLESNPIRKVSIDDPNFFFDDDTITYSSTADFMLSTNNPLRTFLLENVDLEVSLTSGRNRPGFTIPYYVTIKNTGTEELTTNISLTLDDALKFAETIEEENALVDGQSLTYSSVTVPSGREQRFYFNAILDRLTPLGTVLESEIQIDLTDENIENNIYNYQPEVTGSYDPNDKLTEYHELDNDGYLQSETSFEYTIRFQNTGTDTAFTVRVEDGIDKDFDLGSLQMLDASHEYSVSMKNDTITWLFENILLADSNVNEPASHGFIRFRIDQKENNEDGTELTNKAFIYFDFNDPIITNETIGIVGAPPVIPKTGQTISFLTMDTKTFGDEGFSLNASSSNSTLSLVYTSSNENVATVDEHGVVTILAAGTTKITTSQLGNDEYDDAQEIMHELVVEKGDLVVDFDAITTKQFGAIDFNLNATGSDNSLPLTYTSSNEDVATVDENGEVTILSVGATNITVSQLGNENYNDAEEVVHELVIEKADQIITFEEVTAKVFGDDIFSLLASSSNTTLPLTYSSSNEDVATINESGEVTIIGTGSTDITVSQAGDDNYNDAEEVVHELVVEKADQTITMEIITDKNYGDSPFEVMASLSNSDDELNYTTSDDLIASVNEEGVVTIHRTGTVEVTVFTNGTANYNAAAEKVLDFTIGKVPLIITADDFVMNEGDEYPKMTSSFEGFVNGDTEEDLAVIGYGITEYEDSDDLYHIIPSGITSYNYDIEFVNGTLSVLSPLGLTNTTHTEMDLYPNPAIDRFFISNLNGNTPVYLYSMDGSLSKEVTYTDNGIDVSGLEVGVYLIKVDNKSFQFIKK